MDCALVDKQESITLDFDSTSHEQYGQKMEGLAFNYDGVWCLRGRQQIFGFGLEQDG